MKYNTSDIDNKKCANKKKDMDRSGTYPFFICAGGNGDSVARMLRDMIQFIRKVSDSEQTKRAVLYKR